MTASYVLSWETAWRAKQLNDAQWYYTGDSGKVRELENQLSDNAVLTVADDDSVGHSCNSIAKCSHCEIVKIMDLYLM
jgi:hypothetical protein